MFINVIKAEDNRNYVECKENTVFINNDDGTVSPRHNFFAMADRLWVEEEVICSIDEESIYEIKAGSGTIIEGRVLEQGVDVLGNYIVFFNFGAYRYISKNEKRPILSTGKCEINLVFSPDMVSGSENLMNICSGSWPSFHETKPEIIERFSENMTIRFSGGFLGSVVVDMTIKNILTEKCDIGFMGSLGGHGLTNLDIRKVGDDIELRLYNDYIISTLPEGFDRSVFKAPDFDMDTISDQFIEEKHINHWFITCEKIEIEAHIDEDRRRQLEEEHEKFLREIREERERSI